MSNSHFHRRAKALLLAAVAAAAMPAFATDYHWAVSSGTWNNGPNWNPVGEPGINDGAFLDYLSVDTNIYVINNVPVVGGVDIEYGDTLNVEHDGFNDGFVDTPGDIVVGYSLPATLNIYGRVKPPATSGEGHVEVDDSLEIDSGQFNQMGGTLTVGSGGAIDAGMQVLGGLYNLSGGTLTTPLLVQGGGSIDISGGQANVGDFQLIGGALQTGGNVNALTTECENGIFQLQGGTFSSNQLTIRGNQGTGGSFSYSGGTLSIGTLSIVGGQLHAAPGSGKVIRTSSVSIDTASGTLSGGIDLADNAMIVDYTGPSPLASIASLIRQGSYDPNSGIATGIVSSTAIASASTAHPMAIGYAEASALGLATFAGQSVDSTSVLLAYTFLGDANLDGTVNALDFNALATNYGHTGEFWSDGDFNGDGTVNSQDFDALANNFGQVLPSSSPPLFTIVPEPTCGLIVLAGLTLVKRRRSSC